MELGWNWLERKCNGGINYFNKRKRFYCMRLPIIWKWNENIICKQKPVKCHLNIKNIHNNKKKFYNYEKIVSDSKSNTKLNQDLGMNLFFPPKMQMVNFHLWVMCHKDTCWSVLGCWSEKTNQHAKLSSY